MFNNKKIKALEKEVFELKDRLIKSQDYILNYKDLFKGICMTDAKAATEQISLELKWKADKLEKGSMIAKKGAEIIDRRKEVYDAMLDAQKKESSAYEGLKEQVKAFDWILEKIK